MKLCVYAICKNEIELLPRFLDKCKEADYICILDTGSTDGSYEYLENHSLHKSGKLIIDKFVFNEKQFRFDLARNQSMELIPYDSDICFAIDIDEYPEEGFVQIIKNTLAAQSSCTLFNVNRIDWDSKSNTFSEQVFPFPRVHKNPKKTNIYWHYPIHEIISYNETVGVINTCYTIPLILYHTPTENIERFSNKITLYDRLTIRRYNENPEEGFSIYYMLRTLICSKNNIDFKFMCFLYKKLLFRYQTMSAMNANGMYSSILSVWKPYLEKAKKILIGEGLL